MGGRGRVRQVRVGEGDIGVEGWEMEMGFTAVVLEEMPRKVSPLPYSPDI